MLATVLELYEPKPAFAPAFVGALMLKQNDEWAVCRRDMTLETLAVVSDDTSVRLNAIVAA